MPYNGSAGMVSCGFNNENLIEMKIQIENLRAQMRGVQLNGYQRALALNEYYKLLDYVEELEQLTIPAVVGRSEQLCAVFCRYERDFKELNPTPRKIFRRIQSINDIRGIKFTGIIRTHDWYMGEKEITEAYDHLRFIQPELFE